MKELRPETVTNDAPALNEDESFALENFISAINDESLTHETVYERYKALPRLEYHTFRRRL
jgi:hypothetical protein